MLNGMRVDPTSSRIFGSTPCEKWSRAYQCEFDYASLPTSCFLSLPKTGHAVLDGGHLETLTFPKYEVFLCFVLFFLPFFTRCGIFVA